MLVLTIAIFLVKLNWTRCGLNYFFGACSSILLGGFLNKYFRRIISYNKFIKLQPFIIVFVNVLATTAAFVRTTVHQEVTQRDVRAYTQSTSKSAATEQNKSAVTDHTISLNHVIGWDHAKVIDRESNRMDRWIREVIHIRKE